MPLQPETMPKLGFGLMRLPMKDDAIDLEQVCKMVDRYMASGLYYFDTAYGYHEGKSETTVREAIVSRYPRESFYLATKLPPWSMKGPEDCGRLFQEQLDRTGAGYFDLYLLHCIDSGTYPIFEKYDAFRFALQKKAEGLIRHFGFSFHGSPELLEQVLDEHPEFEFVQIQLNYADWENPVVRAREVYEILQSRGIPMIIMEPVKGGTLSNLPPELSARLKARRPESSEASWALRFAGSLPGIMTILSGMSNSGQLEDNLQTFADFEPLTDEEFELLAEIRRIMTDSPMIGCTACGYCTTGCPMNISIPDVFRSINAYRIYNDHFRAKSFYNSLLKSHGRASDCIACGQCESVCPQHLPIIELLRDASETLDKKKQKA
ncbi:MAG: aldo/keto reductase [Mogibacterium sp.]|nr:aldo/keto reductase [Mogibacterium sp.]